VAPHVLLTHRLTHDVAHATTHGMERKPIPRKAGGRPFDEDSASAKAIRLVRDANYSQAEAAAACGISQSAVSHAIAARERREADGDAEAAA
jgi:hypothetical protein